MTLDATARLANLKDSLKKFFVDNLQVSSGIHITFDTSLTAPKIQGTSPVVKWVVIEIGGGDVTTVVGRRHIRLVPSSTNDKEGFKLAQLRDKVVGFLTDINMNDGVRRIPLYQSHPTNPWVKVGSMRLSVDNESDEFTASDETKHIFLDCTVRWGIKI